MTKKFMPILLGSDINVYGMAHSFHEAYGIRVEAWAGSSLVATKYSKIIDVKIYPGFSEDPEFMNVTKKKIKEYKNHEEPVILTACGDGYAELLAKHKAELSEAFITPYIEYDLLKKLISKEGFHGYAKKYGLPYPGTRIITMDEYKAGNYLIIPSSYPVESKFEDSASWLDCQFEGRKKTFTLKSKTELKGIVTKIYTHGYKADLILQDFIPGDDSHMCVLDTYVDKNHKVKMTCLGHPLPEDPTPQSIGNYMAILLEFNQDLYDQVQSFLEKVNYTDMANFDIKYDERDGKSKFFEINLRQGRSGFYVTMNNCNLARWYIDNYVEDDSVNRETVYVNKNNNDHVLWLGVPKKIFTKCAVDSEAKHEAASLIEAGKYGATVFYEHDRSFVRMLLMKYMFHNYIGRFKKHFEVNKGQYSEKK